MRLCDPAEMDPCAALCQRQGMSSEIKTLWPVHILHKTLADHEAHNPGLLKLIRGWEKDNRNLTTDYRDNNPFELDSEATNWLRAGVNGAVVEYLKAASIGYAVDWQIMGWANVNRMGDYHDPHNHPHTYLSGTYYVKMPQSLGDKGPSRGRNDRRPNRITFYDPRPAFNMNAIAGDPYIEADYTVDPAPGLLLLWPAPLIHFVHPNLSDETRVSISFNIVLKNASSYLPDQ